MNALSLARGSKLGIAVGLGVFVIAIVGTQLLGWEWGTYEGPLPVVIGVVGAVVSVALLVTRRDE